MSKHAALITLSVEEEQSLRQWVRAGTTEQRLADRARAILLAGQGQSNRQIAKALQTRSARVSKWRTRFAKHRLDGLRDGLRSGRPRRYDATTERRILRQPGRTSTERVRQLERGFGSRGFGRCQRGPSMEGPA